MTGITDKWKIYYGSEYTVCDMEELLREVELIETAFKQWRRGLLPTAEFLAARKRHEPYKYRELAELQGDDPVNLAEAFDLVNRNEAITMHTIHVNEAIETLEKRICMYLGWEDLDNLKLGGDDPGIIHNWAVKRVAKELEEYPSYALHPLPDLEV